MTAEPAGGHIHSWTRDNLFLVRRVKRMERDKRDDLVETGTISSVETSGPYSPPEVEYCSSCGLVRVRL